MQQRRVKDFRAQDLEGGFRAIVLPKPRKDDAGSSGLRVLGSRLSACGLRVCGLLGPFCVSTSKLAGFFSFTLFFLGSLLFGVLRHVFCA